MSYCVVIPAAGSGSRMGAALPKVLLKLKEYSQNHPRSILQETVRTFAADAACRSIVVCAPAEWRTSFIEQLSDYNQVVVTAGGATRQESVLLGVEAFNKQGIVLGDTVVLVHDAARCCLTQELIKRVVEGVRQHGAVTAAVPVVDSLCRVQDGILEEYVDRKNAWAIQTPQGFLLQDLLHAHKTAQLEQLEALDDAELVARIRPVHIILGDRFNIKVTQPHDLEVADRIISSR